jgi:hypothetical protein
MTTEQPQSLGDISILYRMLLGQYYSDRKVLQDRWASEGWLYIRKPWLAARHLSDAIVPEGKQSGRGGAVDAFGCEVVYAGGVATLESLEALDVRTLATLIEWNRINLVRVERLLFIRRAALFLIAVIGAFSSASKTDFFRNMNGWFFDFLRLLVHDLPWAGLLFVIALWVVLELTVARPQKARLEEFGQMLSVAFVYVSRAPLPELTE